MHGRNIDNLRGLITSSTTELLDVNREQSRNMTNDLRMRESESFAKPGRSSQSESRAALGLRSDNNQQSNHHSLISAPLISSSGVSGTVASVDGTHKPISSGQMRRNPNQRVGRKEESRKGDGGKDHHPLHAQNNSWLPPLLRSDPINTAGQGTTPTLGTTTAEMISVLPPSSSSLSRCSLRNFSHHYYSGGFQRGPL